MESNGNVGSDAKPSRIVIVGGQVLDVRWHHDGVLIARYLVGEERERALAAAASE